MASTPEVLSIVTGVLVLVLIIVSSVPAVLKITRSLQRDAQFIRLDAYPTAKPGYEDEDGEASESSLQAYSDTWQKVAIAIFSVTGMELSLALAILSLQAKGQGGFVVPFWLQMGGWVSHQPSLTRPCSLLTDTDDPMYPVNCLFR